MNTLTDPQKRVLDFIEDFYRANRFAPTYLNISTHCGWASVNTARGHCIALARKGRLEKTPRGYVPVVAA